MKTYKSMLSVVCCWCLCLSLCTMAFAKEAMTQKEILRPAIEVMESNDEKAQEKIALEKKRDKEIREAKMRAKYDAKLEAASQLLNANKSQVSVNTPTSINIERTDVTNADVVEKEYADEKFNFYKQLHEEHAANFNGPTLWSEIRVAPENGSRDGTVTFDYCTDYYYNESFFILLDTAQWWAWGSDGWVGLSEAYECGSWSATVPAGNYVLIAGDSWGDGGLAGNISVNGELVGGVDSADAGPDASPYSGLYEAQFNFDVTDEAVVDATVTFDLDGVEDCGFVSVTGTFDDWSGWGANNDTGMSATIAAGDHEFVILCVNTVDGWWYDIWANSTVINAPIDGSCWNGNYDYANYTLTVGADDMTVAYCAGTCDAVCADEVECSDYTLTVGGGSYDSEISWDMSDGSSGAAGTFELCLEDGDYTFNGYDSWGDGWNGASATFTDADGNVVASFAVEGAAGSWTVTFGGAPPVAGCTDSYANNFDPYAEVDDGSCTYDCAYTDCGYWLDTGSYTCAELISYGYDCSACEADGSCDAPVECSDDQFACASGDQCIPASYFCDGSADNGNAGWGPDCADGSDEVLEDCCAAEAGAYSELCGGGPVACADTDCGYVLDNYNGYTCEEIIALGYDCTSCLDEAACPEQTDEEGCWFDWSSYGAESCDAAFDAFGLTCADLEAVYGWDCSGCACPGDVADDGGDDCASGVYDCAGVCDGDSFTDCVGTCLGSGYLSWIGDGYCDDGAYGADFVACGDFNCDNGDCGTELQDDGSCGEASSDDGGDDLCYGLVIAMFDSYGDGWNGNVLTVGDQTFSLDETTDGDGLSSGTACYEGPMDVVVTCGGGSYPSEVSWAMYDYTGTALLSGGAPFEGCLGDCGAADDGGADDGGDDCAANAVTLTVGGGSWDSEITWDMSDGSSGAAGTFELCLEDGDYTFNGYDSYGDGWNGASATFTDADGNLIASFAVEGDSGSWTVTIGGEAPVAGCTDPSAPEYNEEATLDDGSCWAACTGVPSWIGDGYCDNSNNSEGCAYDGGDCCPGDCVDSESYDCATWGGDCTTCMDPGSADLAEGGQCADYEMTCADTDCGYFIDNGYTCEEIVYYGYDCSLCEEECASQTVCEDEAALNFGLAGDCAYTCEDLGLLTDCDGLDEDGDGFVECYPDTWIADGLCDGADQAYGADLSCYGCDGGDCGQSNEAGDGCEEVDCAADWAGCLESLAVYDEYNGTNWAAECAECADTCAQNPDVPMLTDACYAAAFNIGAGVCEDPCAQPPLEWDAEVTGLTAEGVIYDDGVTPAIQWDWDDLADGTACEDNGLVTCSDGSCAATAEDCPEDPYAYCTGNVSWIGDGYCDGSNNNAECGFDAGDCCPTSCDELVAEGCPDNPAGCYSTISCGDCNTCVDPNSSDLAAGGACEDYEQASDLECADSVTIAGSGDLDGDGYTDDCYTDGSGYFSFNWDGGCLATNLYYVDAEGIEQSLDLSAYGFTGGFFFYGFGFNEEIPFILSFAEAATGLTVAMTDCAAAPEGCSDGYWDCGDGQCIPESYVCDGSSEFGNAGWGADCSNGADETLEDCCDTAAYAGVEACGGSADDGGGSACADDQYDCGDGQCIPASYYCDGSSDNGNAGWPADCSNGSDEVLEDCCAAEAGAYAGLCGDEGDGGGDGGGSDLEAACLDAGGHYCGDDQSNWTSYSPDGCVPSYYICDGWADCVDASDETCRDASSTPRMALSTNKAMNEKVHSFTIANYKKAQIAASVKEEAVTRPSAVVDILTGEITYFGNESNRLVSYELFVSCDACVAGGPYEGSFVTSESELLIYGFDADSEACGNVVATSSEYGSTAPSADACATTPGEATCDLLDCTGQEYCGFESWIGDGYCDDGSYGYYFDCEEFSCDNGDCTVVCWDGSEACGAANCPEEPSCNPGDVNGDDDANVQDIVVIVGYILDGSADFDLECADANADGSVNVQDIVVIVNMILGGRNTAEATEAKLNIANGSVSVKANGFVGAIQMTLSHGSDFAIELTDKAMVADYRTNGNSTTLIVVAPEGDDVFTASGDFTVEEVIVANENSQATIAMPTELTLSKAYPNPFNPSTTFDVYVPAEGALSLNVYNVMGQLVDVIHSGSIAEGSHSITWNASNMTSGVYFVRAESVNGVSVQKVMLMK